MTGISEVANNVRRIPLPKPLLFKFSQRGKGVFPGPWTLRLIVQVGAQRFTNHLAPRPALCSGGSVYLFQELIGNGDHNLGHGAPPKTQYISSLPGWQYLLLPLIRKERYWNGAGLAA